MKNLLTATLPGLALLALGGCATSGALTTSTETDGVYYSSSDHTTAVAAPIYGGNGSSGNIPARALDDTVPVATTDDANPDYQGGTSQGYATGTDYYSNRYNDGLSAYTPNGSGFNQPYAGPGVSSYNYNPGWSVAPSFYGSPFGYGAGLALGYGYSPYSLGGFGYPYGGGFYDPFYSPYYAPYGFGYGSGLSIGFGYGFGGFGGFGYPYGGGFGYPYGYGGYPYGYSRYGRGNGYYDGYGAGYARPVIYTRGAGASSPGPGAVLYGSRNNRGGAVMNSSNATGTPNPVNMGGGRPSGGSYTGNAVAIPGGNAAMPGASPAMPAGPTGRGGRAVTFGDATGQPTYSTPGNPAATAPQSAGSTPSRRGFFGGFFGNGTATGNAAGQPTNAAGQPMNNSGYSRQRNTNYGQAQGGQMQQRSYSQPAYSQPQRTYSQPQPQMQQPSRSFGGGNFGGGGGGGSFGGGGGGGGSRGRR